MGKISMMRQYWVSIQDKAQWNELLSLNQAHQLAHTYDYNYAMHKATRADIFLYAALSDEFSCVCPFSIRQKTQEDGRDIHTPYGFSGLAFDGFCQDFNSERKRFLASQGYICGYMQFHPSLVHDENLKLDTLSVGKTGFCIPLKGEFKDIISRFSSDHRQRYRRWLKEDYMVKHDENKQQIDTFVRLYQNALKTRQAASVYDFGYEAWSLLIKHRDAYLFYVEENGAIEAAALFFSYNKVADYYMTATTENGKKHTRGLICHALQFFKEKGDKELFLGCGVHEGDALHTFKQRFGAVATPTSFIKEIYNPVAYDTICEKYCVNPVTNMGYFPAYWAV